MKRFSRYYGRSPDKLGLEDVRAFQVYLVQEITRPILERWQRHLFLHRKADGEPLTVRRQLAHIHPLEASFRWLARENHILYNPAVSAG